GLILPSLIGAPLQGVEPARAGVAAGMLSTTQQFAGVTGIAALGSAFFAALGAHPDRAAYARAAELDAWLALGITVVLAALVVVLARASEAEAARQEGKEVVSASRT